MLQEMHCLIWPIIRSPTAYQEYKKDRLITKPLCACVRMYGWIEQEHVSTIALKTFCGRHINCALCDGSWMLQCHGHCSKMSANPALTKITCLTTNLLIISDWHWKPNTGIRFIIVKCFRHKQLRRHPGALQINILLGSPTHRNIRGLIPNPMRN